MNKQSKQIWIRVALSAAIPIAGLIYIMATSEQPPGPPNGQALYEDHCANCHGKEGEGFKDLYPPLAGADYLLEHQSDLPCIIVYGMEGPIVVNGKDYNQRMLGIGHLKPFEVAKITNYVLQTWAGSEQEMTTKGAEKELRRCEQVGTGG